MAPKIFERLYKWDKTGKKLLTYDVIIQKQERPVKNALFPEVYYEIERHGNTMGAKVKDPTITAVQYGKSNRTVLQQAELEAASFWNKKKDEGYKDLPVIESIAGLLASHSTDSLIDFVKRWLPKERTDAQGFLKPMKCLPIQDAVLKKGTKYQFPALAQRKLNGFRCFCTIMNGEPIFTSSSGKPYQVAARLIAKEVKTLDLPEGTILDGELYIHGRTLNEIQTLCTTEYELPEQTQLELHVFDLPSPMAQRDRNSEIEMLFARDSVHKLTTLKRVDTYLVRSLEEFKKLHDKWVEEGYEGAILRNLDGKYQYGVRSHEVFKMKEFMDEEFEIVDAKLGSRGIEDMVFIVKKKDGRTFGAKPEGKRYIKEDYWNNLHKYIGLQGKVRFLNYNANGMPEGNTVFLNVRKRE